MKKIAYVGNRDIKEDNIAQTGLIWTPGQIHEVADDKKAAMLLGHPDVWADAEKPFTVRPLAEEPAAPKPAQPTIQVVPQGGGKVDLHWEPIVFAVPAETFDQVRDKALEVVFMSPEDAELFKAWKMQRAAQAAQAERMRVAKADKQKGLEKQAA